MRPQRANKPVLLLAMLLLITAFSACHAPGGSVGVGWGEGQKK